MKKLILPLIIIASVTGIDQLTKLWALAKLDYGRPVEVIGNFFMFTLIYNRGGAMGTNFGSSTYYLIAASLILIFVLYYIYLNRNNRQLSLPLSFIAGGAIGNLIDRIAYGKVVDFIDFDFFDINLFGYQLERWWTFNIADSAISLSIVYLFIIVLKDYKKPDEPSDPTTDQKNESLPANESDLPNQ